MGTSRRDDCPPERRQYQSAEEDRTPAELPRLWLELPLEKRRQLAQQVAHLLQRLRPGSPRPKEKDCVDLDAGS